MGHQAMDGRDKRIPAIRLESRDGLDAKFGVEPVFRDDGFGYGIFHWVEEDGRKAHTTVLLFVLN